MKQARHEAGLSLAQVGKGRVTAPAIYLIETGRTRPSLPTLEHIAERTGKPVEFFLADPAGGTDETQARLAELEAMVAEGRYGEAVELGVSLLELGTSAFRLGRIRYFLAIAHLQLGQPERGVALLADALTHFEAINDGVMVAECLGAQAVLAYMTQRPDALQLAERALEVCRSLNPVPLPTEARLLGIVATAHVANKDWDKAIELYEAAIGASGSLFDLKRLASIYSGLGSAYHALGQVDTAARYAMRSVALLEILRDRVSLARAENALGLILKARGDDAGSRQHLERSQQLSPESELGVGRSLVLLSVCELCLEQGDVDQAGAYANEALKLAKTWNEGSNVAEAHIRLAMVADRLGDGPATDREFKLAIQGFEQVGAQERLFECHGIYAEILEKRGDVAEAYAQMKLALQASRPGLKGDGAVDALKRHSGSLAVILPIGLEHMVHRTAVMLETAITAALSLVG
ncbi:MAG TPA: tetratricopeptide repeat protein [Candidatus Dormibacteraeota bacterium]|nr:tetratricopeptide repeat protein [Candidatus Dormibacteraeota bacterium]